MTLPPLEIALANFTPTGQAIFRKNKKSLILLISLHIRDMKVQHIHSTNSKQRAHSLTRADNAQSEKCLGQGHSYNRTHKLTLVFSP